MLRGILLAIGLLAGAFVGLLALLLNPLGPVSLERPLDRAATSPSFEYEPTSGAGIELTPLALLGFSDAKASAHPLRDEALAWIRVSLVREPGPDGGALVAAHIAVVDPDSSRMWRGRLAAVEHWSIAVPSETGAGNVLIGTAHANYWPAFADSLRSSLRRQGYQLSTDAQVLTMRPDPSVATGVIVSRGPWEGRRGEFRQTVLQDPAGGQRHLLQVQLAPSVP